MFFIICDDNKEFAESLRLRIKRLEPSCSVIIFNSAEQLRFNLPEMALYTDAIFMDINLGSSSGIREATELLKEYPGLKIVYITGYSEKYSQEIFRCPPEMSPTAFLVKPVKDEFLKNAVERIKGAKAVQEQPLCLKNGGSKVLLQPSAIKYISVQGRKVTFYTETGAVETNNTLGECVKRLPDYFIQCHKSFCVNIRYIRVIHGRKEVVLTDGTHIPISRGYAESFLQEITMGFDNLPE
ncbi:MAG: LytR/AlgR family response regulator transcription factor [Ruminiclostridium sp.]